MNRKQCLAFVVVALVWGSTWIAAGVLADQIPPLLGEAARLLLAALLLFPVILYQRLRLPARRALLYVLLLSATMIVLPFLLLLWARPNLPSATVAVVFAAMPLCVVLLTPLLEGKDVPRLAMPAAVAGMGSIAWAMGASLSASQARGAGVLLVAVVFLGVSSLVAHREFGYLHPVVTTALLLGSAAFLLFLASLALERDQPVLWNRAVATAILFLAAIGAAPAYAVYFWLLQRMEAYQAATLQWLQPLVAMFEAALFLRMGLSFTMVAGTLVTLVCVTVCMRAHAKDDDTVSLLGN